MVSVENWLRENWFLLLQAAGIVGGLFFTCVSIRRDTRARKMSDLLALTAQHRELWREVHQRPDLKRILDVEVDLLACPMTVAEREFLNTVIVHFNTGWSLARTGALLTLDTLAGDAGEFFRLPLPKAVWNETRTTRDQGFVRFIDGCIEGQGTVAR